MSEWNQKYLKEIVDIRVSNVDKKIYPNKSLVKLCNYMDVYSNNYITDKLPFSIGSADIIEIQKFGLKNDDVLITKDSETPEDIAISSVVTEELVNVVCGYHLAILRPDKNKISGRFLMLQLKQPELKKYFSSAANGSTRYGLTIGTIEKAPIKYPSLDIQLQIAHILSTTDSVIEKTQSAIAKYKAIKQGMLYDLFTRGIDITTGKLRPKYEDSPELYKGSKLGWIPKEWRVEKLDDCIDKNTVITYGIVQTGEHVQGGIRVLRTVNLNDERIDSTNLLRTTKAISDSYQRTLVKENDIVCNVRASVGDFNIISRDLTDCNLTRGVARISIKSTINPFFILWFLRSEMNKKQMDLLIKGTTFIDINIADLRTIKVIVPTSITEQERIAECLSSIDHKLQKEQSYLNKLQQIKSGLMNDLLSGKVKVKV